MCDVSDKIFYHYDDEYFDEIDFKTAWEDEKLYTTSLFYLRCHKSNQLAGGNPVGNHQLYIKMLKWLANEHSEKLITLFPKIIKYGTWKDLIHLMDTKCETDVILQFRDQLIRDLIALGSNKKVSLAAKWVPTERSHYDKKYRLFKKIAISLGVTNRQFRVEYLTPLRKHLAIVERFISNKEYHSITYSKVPRSALQKYEHLFLKHDSERFNQYLNGVSFTFKIWGTTPKIIKKGKSSVHFDADLGVDVIASMSGFPKMVAGLLATEMGITEWIPLKIKDLSFNTFHPKEKVNITNVVWNSLKNGNSGINIAEYADKVLSYKFFSLNTIKYHKHGHNDLDSFLNISNGSSFKIVITNNYIDYESLKSYSSLNITLIFWCLSPSPVKIIEYRNIIIIEGYDVHIYNLLISGNIPRKEIYRNKILSLIN